MVNPVRLVVQILAVTLLLCVIMWAVDAASFRSGWNVLWMIGVPFGVAYFFDRGFDRGGGVWPLVGLYLLIWSFLAIGVIATLFGIGR